VADWVLSPYLRARDASKALEFYTNVFDAVERCRYSDDNGRIMHAEIDLRGNVVCIADVDSALAAQSSDDAPIALYLRGVNVDELYARALAGGATSIRQPADQPYGERSAGIRDPFGHHWWFGSGKAL